LVNVVRLVGFGVLAGAVSWVVAAAVNWAGTGGLLWYQLTSILWKDLASPEVMAGAIFTHVVLGVFFALAYTSLRAGIPHRGVKSGLWLGFLFWLVGGLPFFIGLWTFSNIPDVIISTWALVGLVSQLSAGVVVAAGLGQERAAAPVRVRGYSRRRR
jgi:hypothetical protein